MTAMCFIVRKVCLYASVGTFDIAVCVLPYERDFKIFVMRFFLSLKKQVTIYSRQRLYRQDLVKTIKTYTADISAP